MDTRERIDALIAKLQEAREDPDAFEMVWEGDRNRTLPFAETISHMPEPIRAQRWKVTAAKIDLVSFKTLPDGVIEFMLPREERTARFPMVVALPSQYEIVAKIAEVLRVKFLDDEAEKQEGKAK